MKKCLTSSAPRSLYGSLDPRKTVVVVVGVVVSRQTPCRIARKGDSYRWYRTPTPAASSHLQPNPYIRQRCSCKVFSFALPNIVPSTIDIVSVKYHINHFSVHAPGIKGEYLSPSKVVTKDMGSQPSISPGERYPFETNASGNEHQRLSVMPITERAPRPRRKNPVITTGNEIKAPSPLPPPVTRYIGFIFSERQFFSRPDAAVQRCHVTARRRCLGTDLAHSCAISGISLPDS